MVGFKSEDLVCMTPSQCAEDIRFLVATKTSDLEGLRADGILGLSPSNQMTEADMLLDELKEKGLIDERVFSI